MRCLSLNQPYADLIVEGSKTIELRGWRTRFRGEFLVHASKKSMMPFVDEMIIERFNLRNKKIVTGAIIGKAFLYDVRDYSSKGDSFINMDLLREDADKHLAMGYEEGKQKLYGFLIKNAVKFKKPIPCKGQLNFFTIHDQIKSKIEIN